VGFFGNKADHLMGAIAVTIIGLTVAYFRAESAHIILEALFNWPRLAAMNRVVSKQSAE